MNRRASTAFGQAPSALRKKSAKRSFFVVRLVNVFSQSRRRRRTTRGARRDPSTRGSRRGFRSDRRETRAGLCLASRPPAARSGGPAAHLGRIRRSVGRAEEAFPSPVERPEHGVGVGGRRAEDQAPSARGRGQDGGPSREHDAHGGLRGAAQARSRLVRGGVRRHAKARPREATHVRDQAGGARAEAVRAGGGHRRVPRFVQDGQQVRGEVLRELHHEGLEAVHRHGVRAQGTVPTRSTRRTTGASLGNTKNHFSPGGGFRFLFLPPRGTLFATPARLAFGLSSPRSDDDDRLTAPHPSALATPCLRSPRACSFGTSHRRSYDLSRRCTITDRAPCTI